jgi:hypothetical protein
MEKAMSGLGELKKERLSARTIRMQTFRVDDQRVLVEGSLDDERMIEVYGRDNSLLGPGPVHGMKARFLIGGIPPKILDAEAEMPEVPMEECPEVRDRVKELIGLTIAYGYSREVKKLLGGVKGCVHLTSLILAMGPAALHGWNNNNRRRPAPAEFGSFMLEYIKNSCWVWREDGEKYQGEAEEMKKRGESE